MIKLSLFIIGLVVWPSGAIIGLLAWIMWNFSAVILMAWREVKEFIRSFYER